MLMFTLDTNCIIALEEHEPAERAIRTLVAAHEQGHADGAIVAISASERQKAGHGLGNFAEFKQRLVTLGLGDLGILKPIFYYDLTFWDCSFFDPDAAMLDLEKRIHCTLFPNIKYKWASFCAASGLDPSSLQETKWQNRKCDVLAIWSHIFATRDVFVTEDRRFHKRKVPLVGLGAGRIESAVDAAALL